MQDLSNNAELERNKNVLVIQILINILTYKLTYLVIDPRFKSFFLIKFKLARLIEEIEKYEVFEASGYGSHAIFISGYIS